MRVFELAERLALEQGEESKQPFFDHLYALDRLANAGMWLVVHEVYARNVYLDGRDLQGRDFKADPEGSLPAVPLNMVPAYVGYLGANAITGETRSWLMGQGHCVSAIDSVNVLVDNLLPIHEKALFKQRPEPPPDGRRGLTPLRSGFLLLTASTTRASKTPPLGSPR